MIESCIPPAMIRPDGSLSWKPGMGMPWYAWWKPEQPRVTLDGDFTPVELRAIADHMEQHGWTAGTETGGGSNKPATTQDG